MTDGSEIEVLRRRLEGISRRHLSTGGADLVLALARPAIRLRHADSGTGSHLGGAALLAHPDRWPSWNDRPLSLLAVLDLEELSPFASDLDLPPRGTLNVFYDSREQPGGFRPEDRGGWRVVLSDRDSAEAVAPPGGAEAFVSIGLRPTQTLTIPGWEEPAVEPIFPPCEDRSEGAVRAREAFSSVATAWDAVVGWASAMPNHQVGGWPRLQQAPIWHDGCDGAERMLLQLDTDEDAGWTWGSVGTLFFTVRRSLPVAAACDEAWVVLQSC